MITTEEILARAKAEKNNPIPDDTAINRALAAMADHLIADSSAILAANQEDCNGAEGTVSTVMLDRLRLNSSRIQAMAEGIRSLIALPSPVHQILEDYTTDNGLHIQKEAVPFGVLAIIYESRPNVTSDAAALGLKSGNTVILRSGRQAWHSANAIVKSLQNGLEEAGLHRDRIQLIEDTSHASANTLMTANGYVDLLIPRGGKNLISACVENATVPVIETGTGICHVYVEQTADLAMALNIIENAKCSRPSVCNAEEVLLVEEPVAAQFLPQLKKRLVDERTAKGLVPVELRLDPQAAAIIPGTPAGPKDFDTEFLDYILAVKVVPDTETAIAHINAHSTHHSEAIISNSARDIAAFTSRIDSACLYVNASTRFTDGGCFGMGCEMGISNQKLHARGPMGLRELCTYKYLITGNGQVR